MALYTVFLDYAGGTYVSQARASNPASAIKRWARHLDSNQIHGLGVKTRENLVRQMAAEIPTPISGTLNTWCVSAILRGKLALIHLVKTDSFVAES
jgi:hypothetical protein